MFWLGVLAGFAKGRSYRLHLVEPEEQRVHCGCTRATSDCCAPSNRAGGGTLSSGTPGRLNSVYLSGQNCIAIACRWSRMPSA